MNKYQKLISLTAVTAIIGFSNGAVADDGSEQPAPTSGVAINYYSLDSVININDDGDTSSKTYAGMEVQITDEFKANVALDLEEIYGATFNGENFDWEKAVAELNGTISVNAFGQPVIVVFGKLLEETMKARLSAVPASDASRLQPDELEEVMGVTFALTPTHLDSLTFAVTETKGGDMSFDTDTVRMTVKAEKALNATVSLTGSLSYELNDISDDGYAASIGVVVDLSNMTGIDGLSAYGQVTTYDNFAGVDSKTGSEIGLNYEIGDNTTTSFGVEQFSNDTLVRLGVAHNFEDNWSVTGSVYGDVDNDSKGIELGLSKKF